MLPSSLLCLQLKIKRNFLPNRYGIYPLTAFEAKKPPYPKSRAASPVASESVKSVTPEPVDVELRRIVNMMCSVKNHEDSCDLAVRFCVPKEHG